MEYTDNEYIKHMTDEITFKMKRLNYLKRLQNKTSSEFHKMWAEICQEHDCDPFYQQVNNDYTSSNNYNESLLNDNESLNNDMSNKLYRKIAMVIHPDKLNGGDSQKMQELQKLHIENDMYGLILLAKEYHIKYEDIEIDDMYIILEKKLYKLNKDIENITNSNYYPFMVDDKLKIKEIRNGLINAANIKKENDRLKKEIERLKKGMMF